MTVIPEKLLYQVIYLPPKSITPVSQKGDFMSMKNHYLGISLRNIIFQYHEACYNIDKIFTSRHLTERFCLEFDIKSSIHALRNVLQYLEGH